jgi:hypothetical protein
MERGIISATAAFSANRTFSFQLDASPVFSLQPVLLRVSQLQNQ